MNALYVSLTFREHLWSELIKDSQLIEAVDISRAAENANNIHLYLFFVVSELILDLSDPMPTRTLFYHYQVGHCREPTRTLFAAGLELVRVQVDPEPLV